MTDVPAGWYDDPEYPTHHRYWDGTAWTDHRAPKPTGPGPGPSTGVWEVLADTFQLLGRGWRELVVLALPLVVVMVLAGVLFLAAVDGVVQPGIGEIIERVGQPGFDPDDPEDDAFLDSITLSIDAGNVAGMTLAVVVYTIGGTVASLAVTLFLAALRGGHPMDLGGVYRLAVRRTPRFIGILLLWGLGLAGAALVLAVIVTVAVLLTPLLLLVLVPAFLAAVVYLWPYGALATTTLAVAPTDDPPLRRTIAMIRPRWPFVALRLLVLTVVFWSIGAAAGAITTPFGAANLWASLLVAMMLQAAQSVTSAAGNVVLYDLADGPLDPALRSTR